MKYQNCIHKGIIQAGNKSVLSEIVEDLKLKQDKTGGLIGLICQNARIATRYIKSCFLNNSKTEPEGTSEFDLVALSDPSDRNANQESQTKFIFKNFKNYQKTRRDRFKKIVESPNTLLAQLKRTWFTLLPIPFADIVKRFISVKIQGAITTMLIFGTIAVVWNPLNDDEMDFSFPIAGNLENFRSINGVNNSSDFFESFPGSRQDVLQLQARIRESSYLNKCFGNVTECNNFNVSCNAIPLRLALSKMQNNSKNTSRDKKLKVESAYTKYQQKALAYLGVTNGAGKYEIRIAPIAYSTALTVYNYKQNGVIYSFRNIPTRFGYKKIVEIRFYSFFNGNALIQTLAHSFLQYFITGFRMIHSFYAIWDWIINRINYVRRLNNLSDNSVVKSVIAKYDILDLDLLGVIACPGSNRTNFIGKEITNQLSEATQIGKLTHSPWGLFSAHKGLFGKEPLVRGATEELRLIQITKILQLQFYLDHMVLGDVCRIQPQGCINWMIDDGSWSYYKSELITVLTSPLKIRAGSGIGGRNDSSLAGVVFEYEPDITIIITLDMDKQNEKESKQSYKSKLFKVCDETLELPVLSPVTEQLLEQLLEKKSSQVLIQELMETTVEFQHHGE